MSAEFERLIQAIMLPPETVLRIVAAELGISLLALNGEELEGEKD